MKKSNLILWICYHLMIWGKHPVQEMLRSPPSHLIIQLFIVSRYDLLMRCWKEEPYIRPTFTDLVEELDTMLSKMTNEVQLNNYCSNFHRYTKFSRRFVSTISSGFVLEYNSSSYDIFYRNTSIWAILLHQRTHDLLKITFHLVRVTAIQVSLRVKTIMTMKNNH